MKKTLLILSILLFPLNAVAGNAGWYGALNGGASLFPDESRSYSGQGAGGKINYNMNPGYTVDGALGYNLGRINRFGGLRVEGELSWRDANIKSGRISSASGIIDSVNLADFNGAKGKVRGGKINSFGLLANAWYDIDTGTKFVPYIGGGIGVARIGAKARSISIADYSLKGRI